MSATKRPLTAWENEVRVTKICALITLVFVLLVIGPLVAITIHKDLVRKDEVRQFAEANPVVQVIAVEKIRTGQYRGPQKELRITVRNTTTGAEIRLRSVRDAVHLNRQPNCGDVYKLVLKSFGYLIALEDQPE